MGRYKAPGGPLPFLPPPLWFPQTLFSRPPYHLFKPSFSPRRHAGPLPPGASTFAWAGVPPGRGKNVIFGGPRRGGPIFFPPGEGGLVPLFLLSLGF